MCLSSLIMILQAGLFIEEHDRLTSEVLHRRIAEHLCRRQCRDMCLKQRYILGTVSFDQACELPTFQSEGIMGE
jgi:hypothetical protein